jgi:hypothetical protein
MISARPPWASSSSSHLNPRPRQRPRPRPRSPPRLRPLLPRPLKGVSYCGCLFTVGASFMSAAALCSLASP